MRKVQVVTMSRRMSKGASQDALQGTKAPAVAGVFAQTGVQGVASATLGEKLTGSTVPDNQSPSSVPGSTQRLRGGESPYVTDAEASGGLDLTAGGLKKARKRARKARRKVLRHLKRAMKAGNGGDLSAEQMAAIVGAGRSASDVRLGDGTVLPKYLAKQVRKVARDPAGALARLEALAQQLRPNHPARMSAAAVVLKAKLAANTAATAGGSVRKGLAAVDPLEVMGALDDVSRALGLTGSAAPFAAARINADQQLRRIIAGGASESLRATQDAAAITGGPAARLGLTLKSGAAQEIAKAEAAVREAEASGDAVRLSRAQERLTLERLKAVHMSGLGV